MWRLYFTALFARILHQPLLFSIRFIPALQARTDKRGRTISDFESLGEAIAYLADLSNRKEKVHGHYYIAVEARSQVYGHIGVGRLGDQRQIDAFASARIDAIQGGLHAELPRESQQERHAADAREAADAQARGTAVRGGSDQRSARVEAPAESQESVASVGFLPDVEGGKSTTGAPKVDLSELGS